MISVDSLEPRKKHMHLTLPCYENNPGSGAMISVHINKR